MYAKFAPSKNMKDKKVDKPLLAISVALVVLGLITLASASGAYSLKHYGSTYALVLRQIFLGVGFGLFLFWLGLKLPLMAYKKYAPIILVLSVLLLVGVFIPALGPKIKGAHRWIYIGGISFQPSEILKLGIIIYLASWMSSHKKEMTTLTYGLIPFLVIVSFVGIFLILEPDIGTLGIITLTTLGIFFVGGGRFRQIALATFLGIILVLLLAQISGYRRDRITTFLNPETDPQGAGYQLNQSLIAIGSGGIFGRGLGHSRQKFYYLPEPAGDAVFAIFAEEFGLIGSAALIGLFFAFFLRGMMIAVRAPDQFTMLLASGITLLVIIQVIVNIGALSGLLPLTGIPLPFISAGGTALAFLIFEIGILLNISRMIKKKSI